MLKIGYTQAYYATARHHPEQEQQVIVAKDFQEASKSGPNLNDKKSLQIDSACLKMCRVQSTPCFSRDDTASAVLGLGGWSSNEACTTGA